MPQGHKDGPLLPHLIPRLGDQSPYFVSRQEKPPASSFFAAPPKAREKGKGRLMRALSSRGLGSVISTTSR